MNENEIEKKLIEHIKLQGGIITPLGKLSFTSSDRIGQGGNGVVYLATINGKKIAIKFLISNSKRKYSPVVVQVHRSYAVSMMYIKEVDKNNIILKDETCITLGKKYVDEFMFQYREYLIS